MNARGDGRHAAPRACERCLARSWLLGELSAPLGYLARDPDRLMAALCLDDAVLIKALAGRRAGELTGRYGQRPRAGVPAPASAHPLPSAPRADPSPLGPEAASLCVHHEHYPAALRAPLAPRMLHIAGRLGALGSVRANPVVALLGSRRASDYGEGVAGGIARGLAASGVTVVSALADGVSAAALEGALEGGGSPLGVLDGGLGAGPVRMRGLEVRVARRGAMLSELEPGRPAPRWGDLGSLRSAVALAQAVVLVEARESPRDLAGALFAKSLDRALAAVPGRVSSPLASGPNALLVGGAALVRDAGDVLELIGAARPRRRERHARIERRLREVLERVGAGEDTPRRLLRAGESIEELLCKLSELELAGLLDRGAGARYVVREPLAPGGAPGSGART